MNQPLKIPSTRILWTDLNLKIVERALQFSGSSFSPLERRILSLKGSSVGDIVLEISLDFSNHLRFTKDRIGVAQSGVITLQCIRRYSTRAVVVRF